MKFVFVFDGNIGGFYSTINGRLQFLKYIRGLQACPNDSGFAAMGKRAAISKPRFKLRRLRSFDRSGNVLGQWRNLLFLDITKEANRAMGVLKVLAFEIWS